MCACLNNIVHDLYVYIRDLICNKGPLFKHLKKSIVYIQLLYMHNYLCIHKCFLRCFNNVFLTKSGDEYFDRGDSFLQILSHMYTNKTIQGEQLMLSSLKVKTCIVISINVLLSTHTLLTSVAYRQLTFECSLNLIVKLYTTCIHVIVKEVNFVL